MLLPSFLIHACSIYIYPYDVYRYSYHLYKSLQFFTITLKGIHKEQKKNDNYTSMCSLA